MAIKIGHATSDENGKYSGGSAGDQTGKEVYIRDWYNRPWNKVLRPKSSTVAAALVEAMTAACNNDCIGYDQNQRTTLYTQAKAKNWDLSKITTKCECDCSSLVAVCVNCAGITVSKDMYTGNEASCLKNTGKFTVLTASKYLTSDKYLKAGDILLYENHHTAIALEDGSAVSSSSTSTSSSTTNTTVDATATAVDADYRDKEGLTGTYKTTENLNMRTNAGTGATIICTIPKGKTVENYGYYNLDSDGTKWLYVIYGSYIGYCSSKYLTKK